MFKKYDFIKSIVQMSGAVVCRFLVIEELSPLDSAEFKVIYRPPQLRNWSKTGKVYIDERSLNWFQNETVYLCLGSWCVHYQTKSRIKQEFNINDVPT